MVTRIAAQFISTSEGIINVNFISFIQRSTLAKGVPAITIWLVGDVEASMTLQGEEAETFLKFLETLP